MGGHHSVANLNEQKFFEPFYKLVEYSLALPKTKIIGICLGAQIIAKVLGSQVVKGDKGAEVGFGKAKIISSPHPVFKGINTSEIDVFHLHEDTFAIPKDATHLLSSDIYASQMFSYKDRAFGIQCHIEPTYSMLEVWHKRFSSISPVVKLGDDARKLISSVNSTGKIILENIINL
jgi:GMP synthase-like glutamine amidotransferase